jgi:hypothetical protein
MRRRAALRRGGPGGRRLAGPGAVPADPGIWAPKDVPEEVFATMDQVWQDKIANSKALQDYAADRGALFTRYYEAHKRAMGMVRQNAWLLYDAGKAPNDPWQFGIEKPGGM